MIILSYILMFCAGGLALLTVEIYAEGILPVGIFASLTLVVYALAVLCAVYS